jgi:hypothetical protein
MTRAEWQEALYPLIARAARLDPIAYEYHPAYRGLLNKITRLIEHGLEHEYITPEGAATL